MAVSFKAWYDEIADVTESEEYQTCEVLVEDISNATRTYDYENNKYTTTGITEVYSGQARYIPIRAGVWSGGESQLNATTTRAGRIQLPVSERGVRVHSGVIVTFSSAPINGSLAGRTAKVTDDFQGATSATRTFTIFMDADSEDA